MRFLGLLKADQYSEAGVPPTAESMEKMGKFMAAIRKAGVLVSTGAVAAPTIYCYVKVTAPDGTQCLTPYYKGP